MSQDRSEAFLTLDSDEELNGYSSSSSAKEWCRDCLDMYPEVSWVKVYHLDFTTNKMTLIKEYRRRTESDEEGVVEYI